MKNSKFQLLHPVFLTCIFLLLINDYWLKPQYHNFFTGKLSDIAGLGAFAFFFSIVFPKHKKRVYIISAFLFIYWKSFLSTPLINFLNISVQIPVGRVIDYSDLSAILFLPLLYKLPFITVSKTIIKQIAVYPIAAVSLFAFCATSMVRRMQKPDYAVSIDETYQTSLTESAIMKRLDSMKINYAIDSVINVPVRTYKYYPSQSSYYIRHKDSSSSEIKNIPVTTDSLNELWYSYTVPRYVKIKNLVVEEEVVPFIYLRISDGIQKNKRGIRIDDIELAPQQFRQYIEQMNKTKRWYRNRIYEVLVKKLIQ